MTELERYGAILGTIQDLCPMAHIAGGAVRDNLLDRPIRDVDLFLFDTETDSAAQLLRSRFGYVKVGEWTQYAGFSDPSVVRMAKFENASETIPLCLIGQRSPLSIEENLERFDFGFVWPPGTVIGSFGPPGSIKTGRVKPSRYIGRITSRSSTIRCRASRRS
jgi:hypothetical protein